MTDYDYYLTRVGETGRVEQIVGSIVYASGLANVRPHELVIFENGKQGQVFSLTSNLVEILIFTKHPIKVGTKIVRTEHFLEISVGKQLLGKTIDPFGKSIQSSKPVKKTDEKRPVETSPLGIMDRKTITKPLETGVSVVDLLIPIGKGQRELVIGDRKTGKTNFLLQAAVTAAKKGDICVYCAIGKKRTDIKRAEEFFIKHKVIKNVVIVSTTSQDAPGSIYLTPYSAMTVAEYFKDRGKDVLVILDDLSTHAKFYREIALLGKRFPGRNSYPGDIFYAHSRIMERAGNFITEKGECAITCLPVVETTQGDLSGYIQTNLMSMTDGHLFFDSNFFYQGRRPAVNPFLSVTRVGRQTQTNLRRSLSRELISFLNLYDKMQNFIHFGAELNDAAKVTLSTGNKILRFFNQDAGQLIAGNIQILLSSMIWAQVIHEENFEKLAGNKRKINSLYKRNRNFRNEIDNLINTSSSFTELVGKTKINQEKLRELL